MMKPIIALLSVFCALYAPAATAFAPTFRPARVVPGMKPTYLKQSILRMSEEKPAAADGEEGAVDAAAPTKGEFYDDEYDSAPQKAGISDSMKSRLMAEASTGLDSEQKQSNVILYIIAAIGVLVVLGGQGIFF